MGVHDHVAAGILGALAGCGVTLAVAIATKVRLLPEVIDLSIVPTAAGVASLVMAAYGAIRRFPLERIGRLTLFGTLVGGVAAALLLGWFLMRDVLS